MKSAEEIFTLLKERFDNAVISLTPAEPIDPYINIHPLEVDRISSFLRENQELQFDSLIVLSGVDDANGTKSAEDGTITGGTMSVWYHLESTTLKHKIILKAAVEREKPEISSVTDIWRAADWHEREAYDMYGFIFLNHPDLRRILMPYDWDAGYPLRKDYKNPEFYQGMKVPY